MKKAIQCAAVAAILALPLALFAAGQGPETIDLKAKFQFEGKKSAVIFPHRQHQAKLDCAKCHKDPKGGGALVVDIVKKKGAGNDFHKKLCWPCHKAMKVPKGKSCKTCHK